MPITISLEYSEYESLKMYLNVIDHITRGSAHNSLQYANIEQKGDFLSEEELLLKEEEINMFFNDIRKIRDKHFSE